MFAHVDSTKLYHEGYVHSTRLDHGWSWRIPLPGRGKQGGARVITLYLGERFPVYAVFVYAKNERADLSPQQKRVLTRLVVDIKAQAQKRMRR